MNDPGRLHAAIVHAPIDVAALIARAQAPGIGALSIFLGTVRDLNDGRPVTRVRYAWTEAPVTNLVDEAPLPVGTFEVPVSGGQ